MSLTICKYSFKDKEHLVYKKCTAVFIIIVNLSNQRSTSLGNKNMSYNNPLRSFDKLHHYHYHSFVFSI